MTHKYRVESGPFVGQVDVADGKIVAAPPVWSKFIGQPFYKLEWWLAAKNQSCSKVRIPNFEDPEGRAQVLGGRSEKCQMTLRAAFSER